MTARSHQRGWSIIYIDGRWVYEDTGEPIEVERPCVRCNQLLTQESHDACLSHVPGVTSICCGHGTKPPFTVPALKCWHCNSLIRIIPDGWFCPDCGQHGGVFDVPASDFEEGCRRNVPYAEPQSCQA